MNKPVQVQPVNNILVSTFTVYPPTAKNKTKTNTCPKSFKHIKVVASQQLPIQTKQEQPQFIRLQAKGQLTGMAHIILSEEDQKNNATQ